MTLNPKTLTIAGHDAAGIGHNMPPAPEPLTDAQIHAWLDATYSPLVASRDELVSAFAKIVTEVTVIDDDDTLGAVVENMTIARELTRKNGPADRGHTEAKEPYLRGGRAVDGWFRRLTAPLQPLLDTMQERMNDYGRRKIELAQQAAREAARKRAAEAEAAAQAAREAMAAARSAEEADDALDAAAQAATQAEQAASAIDARPASATRTYGPTVGVASMTRHWKWRVTDFDLIPRSFLTTDDDKIKQAGKARDAASGKPLHAIPGIEWFAEDTMVARR